MSSPMIRSKVFRRVGESGTETSATLNIDLNHLALASAKETFQRGVNVSPWFDLFDELLVSGTNCSDPSVGTAAV